MSFISLAISTLCLITEGSYETLTNLHSSLNAKTLLCCPTWLRFNKQYCSANWWLNGGSGAEVDVNWTHF